MTRAGDTSTCVCLTNPDLNLLEPWPPWDTCSPPFSSDTETPAPSCPVPRYKGVSVDPSTQPAWKGRLESFRRALEKESKEPEFQPGQPELHSESEAIRDYTVRPCIENQTEQSRSSSLPLTLSAAGHNNPRGPAQDPCLRGSGVPVAPRPGSHCRVSEHKSRGLDFHPLTLQRDSFSWLLTMVTEIMAPTMQCHSTCDCPAPRPSAPALAATGSPPLEDFTSLDAPK
ncbi:PREDICTED: uncharacterized protein LOC106148325 [Chinchilla lanigera]|uniref:uncharacterized protein LOC106148325 n=1 Tax=Chinchilla lanigera TaxID=34839 RepID=UPI000695CDAB|nr:PREDICTED: uncharacterized protein LOC106148325 [Chinchilla lanigera]